MILRLAGILEASKCPGCRVSPAAMTGVQLSRGLAAVRLPSRGVGAPRFYPQPSGQSHCRDGRRGRFRRTLGVAPRGDPPTRLTRRRTNGGCVHGSRLPIALDPIISGLRLGPRCRALDLGAGLGGVSQWIAWSTGADVVALEPEWSAAAGARRLFPGISVVQAEAVVSPFSAGSFDAVTLLGVVSLVDDLPPLISEVVRLLRPGDGSGCRTCARSTSRSSRNPTRRTHFARGNG